MGLGGEGVGGGGGAGGGGLVGGWGGEYSVARIYAHRGRGHIFACFDVEKGRMVY